MGIRRSKRTGRFLPKRRHTKKDLTRAKETELYLRMAEKYLAMSFSVMPKTWTERRHNVANALIAAVNGHALWRLRQRDDSFKSRAKFRDEHKRTVGRILKNLNVPTDRDSIYNEVRIHMKRRR